MLNGIGVSPGIAIGKVFLLDSERYFIPERKITLMKLLRKYPDLPMRLRRQKCS